MNSVDLHDELATAVAPSADEPASGPGEPHPDRVPVGPQMDDWLRSLYAEHAGPLRTYIARILRDPQLAEDVLQETMLRAWRNADALGREHSCVGGWLCRVAYRVAVDRLRAKRSRPTEIRESEFGGGPIPDHPEAMRDHAEDLVRSMVVATALRTLSEAQRAVVYEVYYVGRTVVEAAAVLGVPVGTVKSRLFYALRALRLTLAEGRPEIDPARPSATAAPTRSSRASAMAPARVLASV